MSLKGNLETFFLNSILQLLSDDQKSGILQVKNHQKEVKIYFQDGDIVYATGSQRESRLGYHLQSKGTISREKLHECLETGQKEKKALGKVLVEKGYITAEKLENLIHDQIEAIIFDQFVWDKGDFEYKDARLNLQGIDEYEEGRDILIKGFNTFIVNILEKVPSILGDQFTDKIIHEIDKLLDYVDTYQSSSSEKNYIINEVQKIILRNNDIPENGEESKAKSGGLFSRLKRG